MNTLSAITILSIRRTLRFKTVLLLTPALLGIAVFLPNILKGDGTLSGQIQLSVGYTLGFIRFLLALTGIWLGCSAVSSDISSRRIYLIATKPVSAFNIWLGNWLGQVLLLVLMLFAAGGMVYISTQWNIHRQAVTPEQKQHLTEEILVARATVLPDDTALKKQAETLYEEHKNAGTIPMGMTRPQALTGLTEALELENNRISPGEKAQWRFKIPKQLLPAHGVYLRYRMTAAKLSVNIIEGEWSFPGNHSARPLPPVSVKIPRGKTITLKVPESALRDDGELRIEFINNGENASTVILPPSAGPELLCYAGTFGANYVRMLLVMCFQLAFWTAAGVTAGCIFSLPVAALATGWFVLLSGLSGYLKRVATEYSFRNGNSEHRILNLLFGPLYFILHLVVRPLQSVPTLTLLTHGERISWSVPALELLIRVGIYCSILALIGQYALKRRELGMPIKTS